ncbi:IS3 family transposase [Streptomyces sp. 3212.3]|uniref:IS3 family transposase n=1 Tax=Streptomyces sp. 3212.3 TaxID=1938846 RepID=UPI003A7F562D
MIDHLRDGFGVDPVCRVLQLSPSTYFARKQRPKSARQLRDEELIPLATAVWEDSGRTYGARRVTRALARAGHRRADAPGRHRGRRPRTAPPHHDPRAGRPASAGPGQPSVLRRAGRGQFRVVSQT